MYVYYLSLSEHHTWGFLLLHLHLKLSRDVGNFFGRRFASSSAFLGRVTFEIDKSHLAVVGTGELATFQVTKIEVKNEEEEMEKDSDEMKMQL